ncbi:hypothetical protein [Dickeya dianthicola]|uniref:hypothetical protein n=1 Tax=Dickeya dianthicola TaxID=204039 RepID=UPI001F41638C|nr:hypothetical protein [Dickeya dianthicola]MCI4238432.1 hypothetical protein [Dickeya dianthicola]MCI4256322.1 hypothetical protein [Dickeya dianthicola]
MEIINMLSKKNILGAAMAAVMMSAAGAAYAGPAVSITFKNLGGEIATYKPITNNEISTNAIASPKPDNAVSPQSSDNYAVQNMISPDANAAVVRYTMGRKTCVFSTTFINTIIPGGAFTGKILKAPKWTKNAEASGGAVCNATITSQNLSTYAWSVEFTMK